MFAFVPVTFCPGSAALGSGLPAPCPQLSAVLCATAAPALPYFTMIYKNGLQKSRAAHRLHRGRGFRAELCEGRLPSQPWTLG